MLVSLLILSIIFQVTAAVLALRLIRVSRGRLAWVLIAAAFTLRAFRLAFQFFLYLNPEVEYNLILGDEVMGLSVSILTVFGVYAIGPLFAAFRRTEDARNMYIHAVSHDLRNPLTVVKGYADLINTRLQQLPLDDDIRAGLEGIRHGSARMEALIDDLVDAARWDGRQLRLEMRPVRLDIFLPELLQRSAAFIGHDRLILDLPADLPPVMADAGRLERIVLNLLTNAGRYSPPGSRIDVQARRQGKEVVISVQDRGQGIPAEDLPRLFDRFFRGRGGTREGVGLGLYITRLLIEAHGGRIWVESKPGQGSTFFFSLSAAG